MASVQQPEVMPTGREILRVYTKRQRKATMVAPDIDVAENLVFMASQACDDDRSIMARVGELFDRAAEKVELLEVTKNTEKNTDHNTDHEAEPKIIEKTVDPFVLKPCIENQQHQQLEQQEEEQKMELEEGKQVTEIIPTRLNKVQIGYMRRHKRPLEASSAPLKDGKGGGGGGGVGGGFKSFKRLRRDEPNASLSDVMDRNSDHREVKSRARRNASKRSTKSSSKPKRWTRHRPTRSSDEEYEYEDEEDDSEAEEEEEDSGHDRVLEKVHVARLSEGVSRWLEAIGMLKYAENFERHEVEDVVLPLLTFDDLREMGIAAVGARRKMFTAIQEMEKKKLLL